MQKEIHGGDIYSVPYRLDFSANINPLGMPEAARRAAQEAVDRCVSYPDVHCRRLRMALAAHESVDVEDILCGNGAAELIFALAQAVGPKRALLVAPGFAEYEQALTAAGTETIAHYPLREENGFCLDEGYLDALRGETDIAFLCNPNNPTGRLIPEELLEQIIRRCRERNIVLVVDECFVGLCDEPERLTVKPRLVDYPGLFVLRAFTKEYGMPGLRLGYGMTKDHDLLARMRRVLQPWSVSIPAQAAGEAALGEKEYVKKARALVKTERGFLTEELNHLGLTVWPGAANFLFFRGAKGLYEDCRREGILIRDCGNYRGLEEGYFRVAVRTRQENEELIRVLAAVLGRERDGAGKMLPGGEQRRAGNGMLSGGERTGAGNGVLPADEQTGAQNTMRGNGG